MAASVAVVIGNHQGERLLPDCLASLRAQTRPPAEVIVADGASTDGSVAVAEREGARVLRCPNAGLGFLYNRGAEAAAATLVLFLNNDVALDPGCVEALAAALEDDPARFAADARQLDWEGRGLVHGRTTLRRGRLWGEYLPGLHLDPLAPSDGTAVTVCANGAAMLVRRDRHLELGGFDETFFLEWEDLDLCWRAWLRGWPTVFVPEARVRHRVGAATAPGARARRSASSHHNLVRFALKCLPPAAAARVVAGELLRLPRHPRAVAPGLAAAAREAPEIVRLRRSLRPSARVFDELLSA
ncbi:MAG TPA: glycosyltransferase family 2 protein [Gaiellaceae bacterium]|nr:glycosyltransferase family 2 protein [Gaiellaceae bacterium]